MNPFRNSPPGRALALSLCLLGAGRAAAGEPGSGDPLVWLEEVHSTQALAWVARQNQAALAALGGDPRYEKISHAVRAVLLAKDRIPQPVLQGGWVYNFWQDAGHVRGIWRRTRPKDYARPAPQWETLLDLDALAKSEKENWVWKEGGSCLGPRYQRCLLKLSRGGKDALVIREFDLSSRAFVPDGFNLSEAKSEAAWVDADTLLVGTDFGPGSLTDSGYPRIVKLWRRGTPLAAAKMVFEGLAADVSVSPVTFQRPEGGVTLVQESMTFFTERDWVLEPDASLERVPFPEDAALKAVFQGRALAALRSDWTPGPRRFSAGELVALPLDALANSTRTAAAAERVYAPGPRSALAEVAAARSRLYLGVLDNVNGRLLKLSRGASGWAAEPVALPERGKVELVSADDFDERLAVGYEGFLTPSTVYFMDGTRPRDGLRAVKSLPERFDAKPFTVEQFEAKSADGTLVPYFVVHAKGLKLDGQNPTILYGYGGFEISRTPSYLGATGKVWLAAGGVYALANIRGGGEFGPQWHQAAVREKRQKAFDDFLAVARDLERRGLSSPRRLGIMGGSNGGLLVGAAFTQAPELFHAVVCQVPLLDMLRYKKMGAGPSWEAEYGDPDQPPMRAVLERYSPYHNLKPGVAYPKPFFVTSTEDDRVQPGHARKMAAKLESLGDPALYFENTEGGHGAAANLEQRVRQQALQFTYLFQQLFD